MTHFVQDVKDIWRLAVPYFKQRTKGEIRLWFIGPVHLQERWIALGLLGSIIGLEVAFSYVVKQLNSWNNGFYNSLQEKNWGQFIYYLELFGVREVINNVEASIDEPRPAGCSLRGHEMGDQLGHMRNTHEHSSRHQRCCCDLS